MTTKWLAALLAMTGALTAAEPAVPASAAPVRDRFLKAVKELQDAHHSLMALDREVYASKAAKRDTELAAEAARYKKAAEGLQAEYQQAGDLDAVLAMREELKSLNGTGKPSDATLPAKASEERRNHSKNLERIREEFAEGPQKEFETSETKALKIYREGVHAAHDRMLDELTEVVKEQTKAGNLNDALAVREHLQTLKAAGYPAELPPSSVAAAPTSAFQGRFGGNRAKCLEYFGGNKDSQLAVMRGLAWLALQQQRDGSWKFDGTSSKDTVAATGLSLLPFLAVGQSHKKSPAAKDNIFTENVALGLAWLLKQQKPDGSFMGSSGMYSHSLAAIALSEAHGMTGDRALKAPAQAAINFIQQAQGADGSWGYQAKQNGDSSILGWQIQALEAARMGKILTVDKNGLRKASEFLDKVASGSLKATYGYTSPGASKTLTPVGQLCRYSIDGWGPQNPSFQAGVEFIMKAQMPTEGGDFNMYYYYYATRVIHMHQGDAWFKQWFPAMRDLLIKRQVAQTAPPATAGSWDADKGISGTHWGRLGSTAMALLVLQEPYRHLPHEILDRKGTAPLRLEAVAAETISGKATPANPSVMSPDSKPGETAVVIRPVLRETVILSDSLRMYELYMDAKAFSATRTELEKIGRVVLVEKEVNAVRISTADGFTTVKVTDGSAKGKTMIVKSAYVSDVSGEAPKK